jgi:hypothetical protein
MKPEQLAFPYDSFDENTGHKLHQPGLTKREWFAGMAMQGLLSNSYSDGATQPLSTASKFEIAKFAIDQADALIKELEKDKPLPTAEEYFGEYKSEKEEG